jgi:hypothetical protein
MTPVRRESWLFVVTRSTAAGFATLGCAPDCLAVFNRAISTIALAFDHPRPASSLFSNPAHGLL